MFALFPRVWQLDAFATVDEAKWVYRSAQFLLALWRGDLPGTVVNLTPAITTTWVGAIGLSAFYVMGGVRDPATLTEWLASLPEFRAALEVLVAVRWPMAFLGSIAVVGLYGLARRLVDARAALLFGLLLALDPQLIALSRVLGHDAPAGLTTGLALLAYLVAWRQTTHRKWLVWLAVSGALGGLAMLSKAPAFFLVPFLGIAGFVLASTLDSDIGQASAQPHDRGQRIWRQLRDGLVGWLLWCGIAGMVFVALWPAAWHQPVAMLYAVVHNAFLSATRTNPFTGDEGELVPQLGLLYYPIHALFKISPMALLGLVIWCAVTGMILLRGTRTSTFGRWLREEGVLCSFVVLFTLFMTLGGKRSHRYLLPIWPALYLLAALGLFDLGRILSTLRWMRITRWVLVVLLGTLILLPVGVTAPYYLSYHNPLIGGALIAPHVIKIGWGEGLDVVGRWLQAQPDSSALRVGCMYPSALAPFFRGRISEVTSGQLDYVVLYIKQVQEGVPSLSWLRYYAAQPPLYRVQLAGIPYAAVYAGPALQPAMASDPAFDSGILPQPLFFRPERPYLPIGETVGVEVVWLADAHLPDAPTRLTLQPMDDLIAHPEERHGEVFATAYAELKRRADDLVVSTYTLELPGHLPRGNYGLLVDGRPLGVVDARQFRVPQLDILLDVVFGEQIRLLGVQSDPVVDAGATLRLVWQAAPRAWA
ncbi:MAG: glycosyltransferase family 39 protein, partial [Anaerolineae bacterium]|nr:glycosyltransferase family 39 protein [Anaerolineae bacterium]MDW8071078.1 glycosyltransferase family 39 protein [Anaerolineae bacterium]